MRASFLIASQEAGRPFRVLVSAELESGNVLPAVREEVLTRQRTALQRQLMQLGTLYSLQVALPADYITPQPLAENDSLFVDMLGDGEMKAIVSRKGARLSRLASSQPTPAQVADALNKLSEQCELGMHFTAPA